MTKFKVSRQGVACLAAFAGLGLTISAGSGSALAQITSVSRLQDVQPTDWAFQALMGLDRNYKCLGSEPLKPRAVTRYEFAAAINLCSGTLSSPLSPEDAQILGKLREEFAVELSTLSGAPGVAREDPELFVGTFSGVGVGGAWADVKQKEFVIATGALSNSFENHDSAPTISVQFGHDWRVGDNWSAGLEIDGALRGLEPRQDFGPGVFLGAETDWSAQILGRIGFQPSPELKITGLIGVGVTNLDSQVFFGTRASDSGTVLGLVFGGEVEFPLTFLNVNSGGTPYTGFLRITQTEWEDKDFEGPASSPLFNYKQELSETQLEIGMRFGF